MHPNIFSWEKPGNKVDAALTLFPGKTPDNEVDAPPTFFLGKSLTMRLMNLQIFSWRKDNLMSPGKSKLGNEVDPRLTADKMITKIMNMHIKNNMTKAS